MIQKLKFSMLSAFATMTLMFAGAMGFAMTQPAFAAPDCTGVNDTPACQACRGAGGTSYSKGGGCVQTGGTNLLEGNDSVFENVVDILSFIVGAVAVIMLIVGGLRYVLSSGDANAIGAAKNTILYAVIGLVVVFAARAIILFVVGEIG